MKSLLLLLCLLNPALAASANRVLTLDGQSSYVQLPGHIFDDLTEATVEAWVLWEDWGYFSQWFSFGVDDQWRAMGVNHFMTSSTPLQFFIYTGEEELMVLRLGTNLSLGQWCHMRDEQGQHDGALIGPTTFAPGVVGQAFSFDGQGSYIEFPPLIGNYGLGDFTIELWWWQAETRARLQPLLAKYFSENNTLTLVRQAASGAEALAAAAATRPDLVLLDIRMPGMDGVETMRRLRQTHDALPVVAISASVLEHEKQYYLHVGFDAFIDKPFRVETLYACLEQVLEVEYRYAAPEQETVLIPVALPAALIQRCAEAAQFYRITELRRYVAEVEVLGEGGQALAQRLRALVQTYDMDGVVALLNEMEQI